MAVVEGVASLFPPRVKAEGAVAVAPGAAGVVPAGASGFLPNRLEPPKMLLFAAGAVVEVTGAAAGPSVGLGAPPKSDPPPASVVEDVVPNTVHRKISFTLDESNKERTATSGFRGFSWFSGSEQTTAQGRGRSGCDRRTTEETGSGPTCCSSCASYRR